MMLDTSEYYLTVEEERILLRIARESLREAVCNGCPLDLSGYDLPERLLEKHGAFVTLRKQGELRGCVGYISNCESLAVAVRDNALNAALRDSRFPPVQPAELPLIRVEVSALTPGDGPQTPFKVVRDLCEIKVGRDGLYVERPPARGGLLLPQVAVEEHWDSVRFLSAVCRKAGYRVDAWLDPCTQIYRFSAQVFGEADEESPCSREAF